MIKNLTIGGIQIDNYATITSVDGLAEWDHKIEAESIQWLPGGVFFSLEIGFWQVVVYLTITGNDYTDIANKRKAILQAIQKNKKHTVSFTTSDGRTFEGTAVVRPPTGGVSAERELLQTMALKILFLHPLKENETITSGMVQEGTGVTVPTAVPASFLTASSSNAVTITNDGNIPWYPEIVVQAPFQKLIIENQTNGQKLEVAYPLLSGTFTAKIEDQEFKFLANNQDISQYVWGFLPQVEIGSNSFLIYGLGVDANTSFSIKSANFWYGI